MITEVTNHRVRLLVLECETHGQELIGYCCQPPHPECLLRLEISGQNDLVSLVHYYTMLSSTAIKNQLIINCETSFQAEIIPKHIH